MILFAHTHKSGARKLAYKYNLRYVSPKKYLTEKDLRKYGAVMAREDLIYALQAHPTIHAYALPNLKLYFHPDTTVPVIGEAFQKHFSSFL